MYVATELHLQRCNKFNCTGEDGFASSAKVGFYENEQMAVTLMHPQRQPKGKFIQKFCISLYSWTSLCRSGRDPENYFDIGMVWDNQLGIIGSVIFWQNISFKKNAYLFYLRSIAKQVIPTYIKLDLSLYAERLAGKHLVLFLMCLVWDGLGSNPWPPTHRANALPLSVFIYVFIFS